MGGDGARTDAAGRREPLQVRLTQDFARITFFGSLAGVPLAVVLAAREAGRDWPALVVVAALSHGLTLLALRLAIPRPAEGEHLALARGPYLVAACSRALAEVALLPVFRGPAWFLHLGRILHLRLLGATVAWDAAIPARLDVRDPALLEVGVGSVVESGVVIETTTLRAGRAHVSPVRVGDRCVVGAEVILLPGVSLAHDVRIEPGGLLADDVQVGVAAVIGPGARLARGVRIGAQATVGAGAVLADGVELGERARVAAGAFVPAGTRLEAHARFPPRG